MRPVVAPLNLILKFLSTFYNGFLWITHFIERIIMEHVELICSLESELTLTSICSIWIPSENRDILQKSLKLNHRNLWDLLEDHNLPTVAHSHPQTHHQNRHWKFAPQCPEYNRVGTILAREFDQPLCARFRPFQSCSLLCPLDRLCWKFSELISVFTRYLNF